MDYKTKLDIMQKKSKIRAIWGSISAISFGLFFVIIIGFYPISIANSEKSYSNLITYFALKADLGLFLWIAVILLFISIMSLIAMFIGYRFIERK